MNVNKVRLSTVARAQAAVLSRGFTLVEVVITLSVLAVLVGISVPAISGLQRQHEARQPVTELVRMARTVRALAMTQEHPYQIAFDHRGFHAAEFFSPYGGIEEFDELLKELEAAERTQEMVSASQKRMGDIGGQGDVTVAGGNVNRPLYYESFELPEGVSYEIMMRGDQDWVDMSGGGFKRWVFQSSGMCDPFKIRIQSDNSYFEVSFHSLTGDISEEKSYVE